MYSVSFLKGRQNTMKSANEDQRLLVTYIFFLRSYVPRASISFDEKRFDGHKCSGAR